MKHYLFVGCLVICFLFLIFPLLGNKKQENFSQSKKEDDLLLEKVESQLEQLTLEQEIGQMLIITYSNDQIEETLKTVRENQPGGIILFRNNFTTYEETTNQLELIKKASNIPLFISVDQEGGRVQRLKEIKDVTITQIPSMQQLGKSNNPTLSYEVGKVIAEELRVFGINMDFAPVLDVVDNPEGHVIGDRSFGSIDTVSQMGIALAKGMEDSGVIPVYKHFPGHGSTIVDSHADLPIIQKTKEELLSSDLIPFQKAIAEGADIIMIGHLALPNVTQDETPATLSKDIVTGLLKEELGYEGLVITDALNMGALTKHYSEKEIYEMAINAGVDLLLMPHDIHSAIEYIKESISEGKITEEQIHNSVKKILLLKNKKLSDTKLGIEFLGNREHQDVIEKVNINS